MTNREWIGSMFKKVDKKLCVIHDKIGEWLGNHLWLLSVILGVCIVVIIVCSVIVEEQIAVLVIPIASLWGVITAFMISEWLDKEHKGKAE